MLGSQTIAVLFARAVEGDLWDNYLLRILLANLRMRPRRWRSWRHHRLVVGVGYFVLSYSKLEQKFVEQAYVLALSRGRAHRGLDEEAEVEAYHQAASISSSDFKKAASWAKQARQMTNDPALLLKVDQTLSKASKLSTSRQVITHNFAFLGDRSTLIAPAWYVQAYQYVRADWGEKFRQFKLRKPVIHRYTYNRLKQMDTETTKLAREIEELGVRLKQDFYSSTRKEKS